MNVIILVPTYNELESLPLTLRALRDAVPDARIMVIDDDSPDGTGALADGLAASDDRVIVVHRAAKQGLGTAYIDGMRRALALGADVVVEFDADGSHPAEAVPRMVAGLRRGADAGADLVIGSRWVAAGAVVDWPWHRQAISRLGNLYARIMLQVPVLDMTAGCRAYTADLLRSIRLEDVRSQGYCFQIDMTRRAHEAGARIAEVPIVFRERELGESKMSAGIVEEALTHVTGWGVGRLMRILHDAVRGGRVRQRPVAGPAPAPSAPPAHPPAERAA